MDSPRFERRRGEGLVLSDNGSDWDGGVETSHKSHGLTGGVVTA